MSVLTSAVLTRLNAFFRDDSNGLYSEAQKIAAINAAIDDSFPTIADVRRDSSQTLDSATFTYTPTATPEMEQGFAAAYVASLSSSVEPNVPVERYVRQILNGTTWTVVVAPELAQVYNDKVLYLDYNSRVAQVDEGSDTIELPMNYLWQYAAWFLAQNEYLRGKHFDTDPYGKLLDRLERAWQQARSAARRGLPQRLPLGYDFGSALAVPEPISQVNSVRL